MGLLRKWILGVSLLLILCGMGIVAYYPARAFLADLQKTQQIQQFQQEIQDFQQSENNQTSPRAGDTAATSGQTVLNSSILPELWEQIQIYNKEISQNGQKDLVDAWSYEQSVFDLSAFGLESEIFGYLEIPAIDQVLPLYLGATQEHLSKGVAVLGQTSMPVGGADTNCVIAGHRGFGSEEVFLHVPDLEPGDLIYIHNPWGKMTYVVQSTQIIAPDDIDAIKIQEGNELVTLVTCHPYRVSTHRYLVFCTRVPEEASSAETEPPSAIAPSTVIQQEETDPRKETTAMSQVQDTGELVTWLEKWTPFLAIPLALIAGILLIFPKKK